MKMTEWKKYTGAPEQIAEIISAAKQNGFMARDKTGARLFIDTHYRFLCFDSATDREIIESALSPFDEYLLCKPHPLADMICQWARTGQPVWIKVVNFRDLLHMVDSVNEIKDKVLKTTKPDWNIPGAEYSFTAFKK